MVKANNAKKFTTILTDSQKNKIKKAIAEGTSVSLNLNKAYHNPSNPHTLLLTQNQYNKLQDGNTHRITLSHSRLLKHGGFLPFLIPILAGLASAAGIAGGVATTVAKAKESQKNDAERAAAEAAQKLAESKIGQGFNVTYKKRKSRKGRGIYPQLGANCTGIHPDYVNSCLERQKRIL